MFPVLKGATPCLALALLVSVATVVRAQEAAPATKETGIISGTVLDPDGNPAPAVQVRLFHPFMRGQRRNAAHAQQPQRADPAAAAPAPDDKPAKGDKDRRSDRPKPVATTSTDKDGNFSIADVPAGKYVVMAMMRGVGGARREVQVNAGGDARVELKLKERPAKGQKKAQKRDKPASAT